VTFTVVSPPVAPILFRGVAANLSVRFASSFDELRDLLEARAGEDPAPATLDLVGHSTRAAHFLELGTAVFDMFSRRVVRFVDTLASSGVLARARLTAVRLLGCETAVMPAGQRAMVRLSRALGVPVYGTIKMIGGAHYDTRGFHPRFHRLLVEASQLRRPFTPLASRRE
jgi:hypothetical protein